MSDRPKVTLEHEDLGLDEEAKRSWPALSDEGREVFLAEFERSLRGAGSKAMQAARAHDDGKLRKAYDAELRQHRGEGAHVGRELRAKYRKLGLDV